MHNKVIQQSGVPLLLSTLHRLFNLCANHAVYDVSCTNSGRLSCPSFMGCCSHLAWFSAHDRVHAVIHSQKKMQFVNCRLRNVWEQLQQSVNKKPQMIEENFFEDCLNKWVYDCGLSNLFILTKPKQAYAMQASREALPSLGGRTDPVLRRVQRRAQRAGQQRKSYCARHRYPALYRFTYSSSSSSLLCVRVSVPFFLKFS